MTIWPAILGASFVIGLTIYVVAENNDGAGWLYVFILLMGITLVLPGFKTQLNILSGTGASGARPGQGGGGGGP